MMECANCDECAVCGTVNRRTIEHLRAKLTEVTGELVMLKHAKLFERLAEHEEKEKGQISPAPSDS